MRIVEWMLQMLTNLGRILREQKTNIKLELCLCTGDYSDQTIVGIAMVLSPQFKSYCLSAHVLNYCSTSRPGKQARN